MTKYGCSDAAIRLRSALQPLFISGCSDVQFRKGWTGVEDLEPSIVGILVCGALFFLGFSLGSPNIIGLFASIPFGATAIVTLSALGGSSPIIWTVFALMLLMAAVIQTRVIEKIGVVFNSHWVPWLILVLTIYVIASGLILPRLFMGQTTAFVPASNRIAEVPLAPVSGNFTQAAYFTLGVLTFYAFCLFLRKPSGLDVVRRGFLVFATAQVALGAIDLGRKLAGLDDVLAPIRTAGYTMLVDDSVADFWRVVGGCSEASTFAALSVSCLAFTFTYWRATGSRLALILALALLGLLVLSTSSTAFVALAILALWFAVTLLYSIFANRLFHRDMAIAASLLIVLAVLVAIYLADEKLLGPFADLLNLMVFEKHASASGTERAYWIAKSLQSLVDTSWLGIGIGSSRSSSWVVSVLSQLGIIGAVMMGALVVFLLRGMRGLERAVDSKRVSIAKSARAAGLASLLTASISGGMADPGLIFFISLAVVLSCRQDARRKQDHVGSRLSRRIVNYLPEPIAPESAKG